MNPIVMNATKEYISHAATQLHLLSSSLKRPALVSDLIRSFDLQDRTILLALARNWDRNPMRVDRVDDLLDAAFEELYELFWLTVCYRLFGSCCGGGYEENMGELRRHSLAVAICSQALSAYYPDDPKELFSASLVHDIGKAALSTLVNDHILEINNYIKEGLFSFIDIEVDLLGGTHAESAAMILESSGFTDNMVNGVLHHHEPEKTESPLAHFISIADFIAMTIGFSTNLDSLKYPANAAVFRRYHIGNTDIQLVARDSIDQINRLIPFVKFGDDKENIHP